MRVTRHVYEVDGWGLGELWEADGRVVVAHEAPTRRRVGVAPTRPEGTAGASTETPAENSSRNRDGSVTELLQRIQGFFAGSRDDFADVTLDLAGCTAFQLAVATTLRQVRWGELVAYGELAALAGYPRAGRAAGTFCANNRHFLLVPCHRVVAGDGIGSYGSLGTSYKRRLLRLEGHATL